MSNILLDYFNGGLGQEDESILNQWLAVEANRLLFNELQNNEVIRTELAKLANAPKATAWENFQKKHFPETRVGTISPAMPAIPSPKIIWLKYAAAAVLFGGIISGYLLYTDHSAKMLGLAKQAVPPMDVAPGGSKATLTLSDGKVIMLDNAANGLVIQQTGSRIRKVDKGQLAYDRINEKPGNAVVYNTLATPKAGQFTVTLPDGTKVWLNNASSLRYPTSMNGKDRTVELQGEAYFEVVKNKTASFIVRSGEMKVEVLGTNFNVMAYADEENIRTTLLQGAVKIVRGANEILLRPGEQGATDPSGKIRVLKGVDLEEVVAWKNGYFHFDGTSLAGTMRQLARWYDVEVEYSGKIQPQTFSGEAQRSLPLSQVLKGLENSQIHFTIENRKIIVKP